MSSFFDRIKSTKLLIQNYKSFGTEEQGFDGIEAINVVVGRNNSGKSALLDLIQFACGNFEFSPSTQNRSGSLRVLLETPITSLNVERTFAKGTSGGPIRGDHYEFGKQYIGRRTRIEIAGKSKTFVSIDADDLTKLPPPIRQPLASSIESPLAGKIFRRLGADRDIAPEGNGDNLSIAQNGLGFTNVVQRFINQSSLPNDLVERKLLDELNKIFGPDSAFSNIRVRQHKNNSWEVYLEEQEKGAIALSHSGSGLKTVLLVLAFVILLPHIEGKSLSDYVFAFEELENNLHPSLQRRLIRYISERALEHKFLVFLTTHSSAVIDMLSHRSDAQIVHVTHSGQTAKARRVTTYVDNKGILDDLDIRASDLLQANGIVWVEGPSDRLYFNRWMSLVTNNTIQEGVHYQCVFYGGRLLAHLSGMQPFEGNDQDQAVRIFRVNRNALVLIDSDKAEEGGSINRTKTRIVTEVESLGGMAWVTAGREVENYLPGKALERRLPGLKNSIKPFDDLAEFLNTYKAGEGKRFERDKVTFAESIVPLIERTDLHGVLDLEAKLAEVSSVIAGWNRIDAIWP